MVARSRHAFMASRCQAILSSRRHDYQCLSSISSSISDEDDDGIVAAVMLIGRVWAKSLNAGTSLHAHGHFAIAVAGVK